MHRSVGTPTAAEETAAGSIASVAAAANRQRLVTITLPSSIPGSPMGWDGPNMAGVPPQSPGTCTTPSAAAAAATAHYSPTGIAWTPNLTRSPQALSALTKAGAYTSQFGPAAASPSSAAAAPSHYSQAGWGPAGPYGRCMQETTNADEYTGFRLVYQMDRFIASYRVLVVFYLSMFIACYAQVVNTPVFWGAWCALVLMYWEPFLAPPYPWLCGYTGCEECFARVEKWGSRPTWLKPADAFEMSAIRQWLHALRKGLNPKQMQAYHCLVGLVVFPCGSLWAGLTLHLIHQPLQDIRALNSACILVFLVSTYTLVTSLSLVLHTWFVAPRLLHFEDLEIDWRTHDMMFFTCKILGETLNTAVQTLVAGAFVSYMPTTIFWLSILITTMSYTATNLLYDLKRLEGDTASTHSQYGGSVWSSAGGAYHGGAFPSTFGNMLFSHSPRGAAVTSTAEGKAAQHHGVHAHGQEHVRTPCAAAHHLQAAEAGKSPASFKFVANQAPGYAWGSVDGGSSTSGMLPFATVSTPKAKQLLFQQLSSGSAHWDELPSPEVLPSTPPQGQQQSCRSTVSIVASGRLPFATASSPRGQQSLVASQPLSDSGSQWDELPSPGVLPPTPHPGQQQSCRSTVSIVAYTISSTGDSTDGTAGATEAQQAATAAAQLEDYSEAVGNVTLSAGMAEQQQSHLQQQQQQQVRWQAPQGPQQREQQPSRPQQHAPQRPVSALLRRRKKEKEKPKGPPSPPFLTYKAPQGWRDWCIVGLLIAVAAPSATILFLVSWGTHKGQPELYFEDPTGSCTDACTERYLTMLVLLCSLGLMVCYYAFTVGVLQAGPVTWIYRLVVVATAASTERLGEFGARLRTTLAGGR